MEKTNKRLDVLVVEDTLKHQESARILLSAKHNLRIVSNYHDAVRALGDRTPDVLLTDMEFPLGYGSLQNQSERDVPSPLGFPLALYAARPHLGVRDIAIYTDGNHHSGPMQFSLDGFSNKSVYDHKKVIESDEKYIIKRPVLKVNDSNLTIFDSRDNFDSNDSVPNERKFLMPDGKFSKENWLNIDFEGLGTSVNEAAVKDWGYILDKIST